jgi:hypothetical protein
MVVGMCVACFMNVKNFVLLYDFPSQIFLEYFVNLNLTCNQL